MRCALLVAVARLAGKAEPTLAEENRLVRVCKANQGFGKTMAEFRYEIPSGSGILRDLHRISIVPERGLIVTLGEITVAKILEADGFLTGEVTCPNSRECLE
jgi:hypothetical protein